MEIINPVTPVMDSLYATIMKRVTNHVHQLSLKSLFTGTISKEYATITPVPVTQHIYSKGNIIWILGHMVQVFQIVYSKLKEKQIN